MWRNTWKFPREVFKYRKLLTVEYVNTSLGNLSPTTSCECNPCMFVGLAPNELLNFLWLDFVSWYITTRVQLMECTDGICTWYSLAVQGNKLHFFQWLVFLLLICTLNVSWLSICGFCLALYFVLILFVFCFLTQLPVCTSVYNVWEVTHVSRTSFS